MPGVSANAYAIVEFPQLLRHFRKCLISAIPCDINQLVLTDLCRLTIILSLCKFTLDLGLWLWDLRIQYSVRDL